MTTTGKIDLKLVGPETTTTTTTKDSSPDIFNEYSLLSLILGPSAPLLYAIFRIGTSSVYIIWIALLILIWIISGFAAFIAAFVCIFYNSSIGDKIAGLVMALFAGPFYWLFYIYNMNYCNRYTYSYY
jgi:hypothetical protein